MAVRTRTNAKPNSPSTLSEKMTGAEIKETAKQIKETKGFQRNRAPQKKMGENIPWAEVNKNAGQVRESPLSKQVFSEKNLSGAVKEMEHLHKDRERMGEYVERWGNLMQPRIREDGPEPEKKEEIIKDPENEMNNPGI